MSLSVRLASERMRGSERKARAQMRGAKIQLVGDLQDQCDRQTRSVPPKAGAQPLLGGFFPAVRTCSYRERPEERTAPSRASRWAARVENKPTDQFAHRI